MTDQSRAAATERKSRTTSLAGKWIRFVFYGMLGWCFEVVWTGVADKVCGTAVGCDLRGHSYVWMFGIYGLGLPKRVAYDLNGLWPFQYHDDHGRRGDILDQPFEETLPLVNGVVTMSEFLIDLHELHANDLQPSLLQSGDDRADESPLHGVGFDDDQSAFHVPFLLKGCDVGWVSHQPVHAL